MSKIKLRIVEVQTKKDKFRTNVWNQKKGTVSMEDILIIMVIVVIGMSVVGYRALKEIKNKDKKDK